MRVPESWVNPVVQQNGDQVQVLCERGRVQGRPLAGSVGRGEARLESATKPINQLNLCCFNISMRLPGQVGICGRDAGPCYPGRWRLRQPLAAPWLRGLAGPQPACGFYSQKLLS